jgi:S-adenosylmethionine decarboxylase
MTMLVSTMSSVQKDMLSERWSPRLAVSRRSTLLPDILMHAWMPISSHHADFSANGVIPAPDQAGTATHYFTVHVTPEPQCSYASFETNVPGRQAGRETSEIVEHVVDIFKPGRFSVTLFEAKANPTEAREFGLLGDAAADTKAGLLRSARMEKIKGYRRVDRIVHDFDGYDLVFRYYERDGWEGGGPTTWRG